LAAEIEFCPAKATIYSDGNVSIVSSSFLNTKPFTILKRFLENRAERKAARRSENNTHPNSHKK